MNRNIVIVEDMEEHRHILRRYIEEWAKEKKKDVVIREYTTGEQFLFHENKGESADAVFLDIQMPGISGMELARKIRESNQDTAIVFTTGIDDYIGEGYEVSAMHYLLKPLKKSKVMECLEKISHKKKEEQYILLNMGEESRKVAYSMIWWAAANERHTIVAVEDEAEGVVRRLDVKEGFGEMEGLLTKKDCFIKVHRSYLINLQHVKHITKTDVIMDNGDEIPLSRRMYKEVNQKFLFFYTMGKLADI